MRKDSEQMLWTGKQVYIPAEGQFSMMCSMLFASRKQSKFSTKRKTVESGTYQMSFFSPWPLFFSLFQFGLMHSRL